MDVHPPKNVSIGIDPYPTKNIAASSVFIHTNTLTSTGNIWEKSPDFRQKQTPILVWFPSKPLCQSPRGASHGNSYAATRKTQSTEIAKTAFLMDFTGISWDSTVMSRDLNNKHGDTHGPYLLVIWQGYGRWPIGDDLEWLDNHGDSP